MKVELGQGVHEGLDLRGGRGARAGVDEVRDAVGAASPANTPRPDKQSRNKPIRKPTRACRRCGPVNKQLPRNTCMC